MALESGGWDAVRLANMEAISVLKDENPDSKAASLNLPGDSALGVEGTSGHTFPDLFPPLALLAAPSRDALATIWVWI